MSGNKQAHSKLGEDNTINEEFQTRSVDVLRNHEVYGHIRNIWGELEFSHEDLFLGGMRNPLIFHNPTKPYFVYVSDKEDLSEVKQFYADVREGLIKKLEAGEIEGKTVHDILDIEVRRIPRDADGKLTIPYDEHGLLHLPNRAISPGLERFPKGILFNWDTAFIIRGLVQDNMVDLSKDLTDAMLYEIEHYGGILNANGTFCLSDNPDEPRCQPPFIASKVVLIYNLWDKLENPPAESREDWLKRALPLLENHHNFWMSGSHIDEKTGLSKYGCSNGKPAVEALYCEPEHFKRAYDDLLVLHQKHINNPKPVEERDYQGRKYAYYVEMFLDMDEEGNPLPFSIELETIETDQGPTQIYAVKGLTEDYFNGDIAMRESGLDATRRFGFMAADANNLCPYDLNCLRKKMEGDIGKAYEYLAKAEPENPEYVEKSKAWYARSEETAQKIRDYLWDDGRLQYEGDTSNEPGNPMPPSFRDIYLSPLAEKYDLGTFRRFNFGAVGVPLWTQVATEEQAHIIITENYPLFMGEHGFSLSTIEDDYMWGWVKTFSPFEIMNAEGAEIYGYYNVALNMRQKRVNAIQKEYERTGHVWEKMETINGTCNTGQYQPKGVGYDHNDPGFGWTNAEYIDSCVAIPRLEMKIKVEYSHLPCITTNFSLIEEATGILPPQDSPELLDQLIQKAVNTHPFLSRKNMSAPEAEPE